jgi:hypothetical protein
MTTRNFSDALATIRRSEYTGANRCILCTVLNVLTAAAASSLLGISLASLPAAIASFGLFLGLIYARGYLVPGTPELTKRYLPERVLRLFGKSTVRDPTNGMIGDGDEVDVEAVLADAGVVTDCPDSDDLCLESTFRESWFDRIDRARRETAADDVAAVFDVLSADEGLVTEERGDAYVVQSEADGVPIGWWESRTAFIADVAAGLELRTRYPGWNELDNLARSQVLASLRVFLERCPSCDGALDLGTETVSSCCSSYDVVAMTCAGCGARLFEFDASELEA